MYAITVGLAFARSSFMEMLTYRLRYLIGVANYVIYATVAYYLWAAVFAHSERIADWTLPQMQTYVIVAWISRSTYFSNSDNVLASRISKGEIASDLLRPCSLLLQFYARALGEMGFRAIFLGLPVGIALLALFGILAPPTALDAAAFGISIVLAFHLFFAINFLTGLCGVITEKIQGFMYAKFLLLQFLTGVLLPLEFFPPTVKNIMDWLPFKGIAYTPLSIYLGRYSGDALWWELGLQCGWVVLLVLCCLLGWRLVRQYLSTHGG